MVAPITFGPGVRLGAGVGVGPTGGGGGGTPTFTFSGLSQSFTNRDIVVTPDGLTVYGVAPNGISTFTLGSSWDLTSFTTGSSFSYPFNMFISHTSTLAFNNDGTKAITVIQDGSPMIVTYNLTTPYVMSSLTGSETRSSGTLDIPGLPTHLLFANGGMVGYLVFNSVIYQWNLSSPYDINSFSGTAAKTLNMVSLFGLNPFGKPYSFALAPSGNLGYISSLGNSYDGTVTQFSLATPFDISTAQAPAIASITGFGGYGDYLGTAMNSTGTRLFVSGKNSSGQDTIFQFNGA